jgi:hypothetical protein
MYTCRNWERAKAKLQHYRRRQPEDTPLYRIVYHGRDELPRVWEERFEPTYGALRAEASAASSAERLRPLAQPNGFGR